MQVLVKQIDNLKSTRHRNKTIPEYLVYLMVGVVPVECYNEFGTEAKDSRVINLFTKNCSNSFQVDISQFVTEIPYLKN